MTLQSSKARRHRTLVDGGSHFRQRDRQRGVGTLPKQAALRNQAASLPFCQAKPICAFARLVSLATARGSRAILMAKDSEAILTNSVMLLLVEDEPIILVSIEDALTAGGYEVITALNGDEAMQRLSERADGFAGLVTDIRLGGDIDGWDVARSVRDKNPTAAIIYMTGDSGADWPVKGVPNSQLVQKPFAHAQIVSAMSVLLTEANTASAARSD